MGMSTTARRRIVGVVAAGALSLGLTTIAAAPAYAGGVTDAHLSITEAKLPNLWNVTVTGHVAMGYLAAYEAVNNGTYISINMEGVDGTFFKCYPDLNYPTITADKVFGLWPENDGLHFSRTFPMGTVLNEDTEFLTGTDEIVAHVDIHQPGATKTVASTASPDPSFGCSEINTITSIRSNEVSGQFAGQPGGGENPEPQQPPPPPAPPATVPDLIGDTVTQAQQELQTAGLTLGTQKNITDCNSLNRIVHTTPTAGSLVQPGTPVTISVGAKPKPPQVCP